MLPQTDIFAGVELGFYMLVLFLVLFILRVQGFGGSVVRRFGVTGHWLILPWLCLLHIIASMSRLNVSDGDYILGTSLQRLLDTVTLSLLLFALCTLFHRMNISSTRLVSIRVFHLVYTLFVPASLFALLGQFTIIEGNEFQGDIEVKSGLVLYTAILLMETIILAQAVRRLRDPRYESERNIVCLAAQTIPALFIRLLHPILVQFEVLPSSGSQAISIRFIMVILMDLVVCFLYLTIGFLDRVDQLVDLQDEMEQHMALVNESKIDEMEEVKLE